MGTSRERAALTATDVESQAMPLHGREDRVHTSGEQSMMHI